MPFGKFKGLPVKELPPDYLKWLWANVDLRPPLDSEVFHALRGQGGAVSHYGEGVDLEHVKAVYHRLSLKYHPDRGGNHLAMCALNEFYEGVRNGG